jgi:hypothetical protein
MTDANKNLQTLDALTAELMAISEADRAYWPQKSRSREDSVQYQRRQERLKEIRLEMMALGPDTVQ